MAKAVRLRGGRVDISASPSGLGHWRLRRPAWTSQATYDTAYHALTPHRACGRRSSNGRQGAGQQVRPLGTEHPPRVPSLPDGPTVLSTDNKAARDLSYNPEHHDRSKHIARRHFFIRDMVEAKEIVVPLVSTYDNDADFFTKPLPPKRFKMLRRKVMNLR